MGRSRWLLLATIAALVAVFLALDLGQYLDLDYFKSRQAEVMTYYAAHRLETVAIFFVTFVSVAALSLPFGGIMTLVAGAIFGLLWGVVIVSFASSIGALLALLVSRFLLRDVVQRKFGHRLTAFNRGMQKDGALYLFMLRLAGVPFFIVNLVMGLTAIPPFTFYWVTQVGMLAATIVIVNAGTQIAQITSLSDLASPQLLGAFALLGIFPLVSRKIVRRLRASTADHR
jgi:uncharacterized membrane protein YdjX (TVP38/TMEM64 family)